MCTEKQMNTQKNQLNNVNYLTGKYAHLNTTFLIVNARAFKWTLK